MLFLPLHAIMIFSFVVYVNLILLLLYHIFIQSINYICYRSIYIIIIWIIPNLSRPIALSPSVAFLLFITVFGFSLVSINFIVTCLYPIIYYYFIVSYSIYNYLFINIRWYQSSCFSQNPINQGTISQSKWWINYFSIILLKNLVHR